MAEHCGCVLTPDCGQVLRVIFYVYYTLYLCGFKCVPDGDGWTMVELVWFMVNHVLVCLDLLLGLH